jgi:hypothetical protein
MNTSECLANLWDVFPAGKGLSPDQLSAYRAKLQRFSDAERRGIYDWLLENCKFFPKIADIYEAARAAGYLDKVTEYRPHQWTPTDCRLCGGSGLMAAFWIQEFTVGEHGKKQILRLNEIMPYHQSTATLNANPDNVRTVYRCRCDGGNAPALGKGIPKWSADHRSVIERGW